MCPNADNWLLLEQMQIACKHLLADMDEEEEAGPTIFDFWIGFGFSRLLIAGASAIRKFDLIGAGAVALINYNVPTSRFDYQHRLYSSGAPPLVSHTLLSRIYRVLHHETTSQSCWLGGTFAALGA